MNTNYLTISHTSVEVDGGGVIQPHIPTHSQTSLAVQVTGSADTWKIEGSLDSVNFTTLSDEVGSATSFSVDSAPVIFDVSSYDVCRITLTSGSGTYNLYAKGL